MTWLGTTAAGPSTLDAVYGLTPEVYARFLELERSVWHSTADPAVLELMRLRVATLIGCRPELARRAPEALAAGLREDKIAELAQWPTSAQFSPAERAVLSFCETYVMDAHAVTDEMCALLNQYYSPQELAALTVGVAVFDSMARFRTALDA